MHFVLYDALSEHLRTACASECIPGVRSQAITLFAASRHARLDCGAAISSMIGNDIYLGFVYTDRLCKSARAPATAGACMHGQASVDHALGLRAAKSRSL